MLCGAELARLGISVVHGQLKDRMMKVIYRCLYHESGSNPTCVISGKDTHHAWLYIHDRTPMVLRLHPQVVQFLRNVIAELDAPRDPCVVDLGLVYWRLERDTSISYPELLVSGRLRRAVWLNVYAATPSSLLLVPKVVDFLRDSLVDLPATPAVFGYDHGLALHRRL